MADPMQMLQTLMAANRPMPQSGPSGVDPRAMAIAQMMQAQSRPDEAFLQAGPQMAKPGMKTEADERAFFNRQNVLDEPPSGPGPDYVGKGQRDYTGQKESPDLPTTDDNETKDNSGDAGLQEYVDRFGWERMNNPEGPPKGYVPVPRPRYPDVNPNNDGYGDEQNIPEGVDLKPSDIERRRQTAEQDLADVQGQMAPWEGKVDEGPTPGDIALVKKDPSLVPDFVKRWGEEGLPMELQDSNK